MSRTHPDRSEAIMLTFRCVYCGAHPGQWCHTGSGGFYGMLHSARFYLAWDAGQFPLPEALP